MITTNPSLIAPLSHADAVKHLHMCVAIWAACYPHEEGYEHFDTVWVANGSTAQLRDIKDHRLYSFYVEGLLAKYIAGFCREIPLSVFAPRQHNSFPFSWRHQSTITRELDIVPADWDTLQRRLHLCSHTHGDTFHSRDCIFVDKAIALLRSGAVVTRGQCSRIDGEDERWTLDYRERNALEGCDNDLTGDAVNQSSGS
jgi:hypothetical protein